MDDLHQSYCPDCLALYPAKDGFCPFHGTRLIGLERVPDLSGKVLDARYRLDGAVARRGRFGQSYEAEHLLVGKKVLVKVFDPMISRDPVVMKRFNRLVTRQMAFKGTGYIKVLDFGITPEGHLYRVSEWVDGRDLRTVLRQDGPPNPRVAVGWLLDLCKAVEQLHSEGILHLAIKPTNVMIVYSAGTWSAFLGEAGDGGLLLEDDGREYSKLGLSTLEACYVSPEQAAGKSRDVYTDVYALAVLLLEALSGREPFKARCPVDMFKSRLRGGDDWRETLPYDTLPPRLTKTLEMALEPHPLKRLGSATALRAELELVIKREGAILAGLVSKEEPARIALAAAAEASAAEAAAVAQEALEANLEAPVAKEDPGELSRIWDELDKDAKAILVAHRRRGMVAAAVGVALLVAVLVMFFQDIVTGAKRILGDSGPQETLNVAAEQQKGGPRGNGNVGEDLEAARRRALEQLANKDLPGLGTDEANITGDLDQQRVPLTDGLAGGVDKGALARNIEQAMGGQGNRAGSRPVAAGVPAAQGAPGARSGLRIDAAAAVAAAAAAAGTPQAPTAHGSSGSESQGTGAVAGAAAGAGGQNAAAAPRGKSAEELSREAMDKDDFELARMAMDFGKKQMKKGQYLLAVENFRNAKRMGWHQTTVDGLIGDCQRLQKELDAALEQGQRLMRQKQWREAIPYLKRAQKLGDDSNTTNNLILECEDYIQQAEKAAREAAEKQ